MALRKQKLKPSKSERNLSGLWVSYKRGASKKAKLKTEETAKNFKLSIVNCQLIFVANETLKDVYFDDITGMVRRPKIIQEGHYNPFGLPLAGLTTLGNPEYAYFFTGKELYEDEALQWYDYGARMYDVQIGRWTTHDPVYQDASPYVFCGNNGVNYVDPTGMNWFTQAWEGLGNGLQQFGNYLDKNQYWIKPVLAIGLVVVGAVVMAAALVAAPVTGGLSIPTGAYVGGAMAGAGLAYFAGVADKMINGVDDGNGGKRKMGWKEANQKGVLSFSINAPMGGNGTNQADKENVQKAKQQYGDRSGPTAINDLGYQGAGGANVDPVAYASNSYGPYYPTVDNTADATKHYLFSDGRPAFLGPYTVNAMLENEKFIYHHERIINGETGDMKGFFSVNMTFDVFHVGNTYVDYSISCGSKICNVKYYLFTRDGFWDPDYLDENTYGSFLEQDRPDGLGPNLERLGGTPYPYIPNLKIFTFPNPGYR